MSRCPALATLGDVRHQIDARTLWAWLDRFGAESLVVTLAAGHGYAGMLRILRDEKSYDDTEVRLLAGLSEPELFALASA